MPPCPAITPLCCPNGALLQTRLYHLGLLRHGHLSFLFSLIILCFGSVDGVTKWPTSGRATVPARHRQEQLCPLLEPGSTWAPAGDSLQRRVCHQNPAAGVTATNLSLSRRFETLLSEEGTGLLKGQPAALPSTCERAEGGRPCLPSPIGINCF